MSDEEDELEGFSASEEDEWKPSKKDKGGESSDDDDSEFEDSPAAVTGATSKRRESKGRNAVKQTAIKKRKPTGQSLRKKLYNKYRPPPKTASPSNASNNTPSACSSSRTASKNANEPNAAAHDDNDASSDSSVEDYLVNPAELDFKSSFFNTNTSSTKEKSPAPVFDCNAGIGNLSDSGSEDNNESSAEEVSNTKAFDFRQLLEKANSLERTKETIEKRTAQRKAQESTVNNTNTEAMDVNSLLALGENQQQDASNIDNNSSAIEKELDSSVTHRLSKTKSTRVKKRVSKTRPTSKVVAGDTDDSDWEEVAGMTRN